MSCPQALGAEGASQARPGWIESKGNEQDGRKNKVTAELASENTQPVGLIGNQARASLVAYKSGPGAIAKAQGFIEFSTNVLINSFSRKVCHSSSCVMEVKFDGQPVEKFKLFEAGPEYYLKRVLVYDQDFFKKAFKSRAISVKLKFADSVEGVYVFRNPNNFDWSE